MAIFPKKSTNTPTAIDRLNQEIGEINTIRETNSKVIIRINNIFKDED